jgi:3-methylfumaryl-CoA hydratase
MSHNVPDSGESALVRSLKDWQPGSVQMSRRVDPWSAAAFAGLIGAPVPPLETGDPLPPMWHWFTLLEHPAQAELGADGHPARGPFLPPIPGRRRMWAGGRLRLAAPISIGAQLSARSTVAAVSVKSGRRGQLAFVTVRHELSVDGGPAGVEEQDIVYRSEPNQTAPRRKKPDSPEPPETPGAPAAPQPPETPGAPAAPQPPETPGAPAAPRPPETPGTLAAPRPPENPGLLAALQPPENPGAPAAPGPSGAWRAELATDPVLLFRFSALTYNGHRIHYDRPYATEVEGYPDLVVHGPLLALLALELPRLHASGRAVRSFGYRLVRPAFVPATVVSEARLEGATVELTVAAKGAPASLTATATLD